jgi:hypothetical protein
MQRSLFLAKLIGPLLAVLGLTLVFNADIIRIIADEFLKSYALIYLAGVIAFVAGLAIVNAHNEWTADWRVAITILGWLCVIGGILRVAFPRVVEMIGTSLLAITSNSWIIGEGIIFLALGAWLSFEGYGLKPARPKRKR